MSDSFDSFDFFAFTGYLDDLKHLKRKGWVYFDIEDCETVASHQYRMAVLAMTLNGDELNIFHCIKMALVHDIGEAIIGDITPKCGISSEEKSRLENEAVKKISDLVPHLKDEIYILWLEYEANETKEAKAVKQLDKIDVLTQALTYEKKLKIKMPEFFEALKDSFSTQPFIKWHTDIVKQREDFWENEK